MRGPIAVSGGDGAQVMMSCTLHSRLGRCERCVDPALNARGVVLHLSESIGDPMRHVAQQRRLLAQHGLGARLSLLHVAQALAATRGGW
jgi:hypothetical protein